MFTRNHIQLTGNIAKPAESRAAGETTVTRARLLHNEAIRKADGETVERLVAVDIEIWGKRGDAFAEYVTTKTPVYVEGRLQLDQWQAEDGSPRSRLLVRVEDWQFLAPRPQDANGKASGDANGNGSANADADTGTNTTNTTTTGTKTKRTNAKAGAVA